MIDVMRRTPCGEATSILVSGQNCRTGGATWGFFLGVDLHARNQSICWIDTAQGEIHEARLDHQRDDIRGFYEGLPAPAVIGVESTGYALWFHKLVEELGHTLLVGDALAIRQLARRRQKNDRRDASLVLDLLIRGDFPLSMCPLLQVARSSHCCGIAGGWCGFAPR